MDSEYLETIFIAVPRSSITGGHADLRSEEKGFFAKYETLTPNVVPRSANKLAQDDEFSLFGITLFHKDINEFNHRCRELKYRPHSHSIPTPGPRLTMV
jgi:V-type H+-transporting ATPase subunit C